MRPRRVLEHPRGMADWTGVDVTESMQQTHACIRCRQTKPVSAFYVRSDTGKLKNTCRDCVQGQNRRYAEHGPQTYGRYQKYDLPDGRRRCRICDEIKSLDNFQRRSSRTLARRNECSDCFRRLARDRYHSDPDKHRDQMRRTMYGLAPGEYDRMNAEQNGLCAICGSPETSSERYTGRSRKLFVDHHHASGQVRQLLCMRCNVGIGQFRDDPDLLKKAIAYLDKHRPRN